MKRSDIPFLLFGILFVLTIPIGSGAATSVVPGWRTAVISPHFLITVIISVVLLFVTIGYRKLARKNIRISSIFLFSHALLTIPAVIFIRAPFLLLSIPGPDLSLLGWQVTLETAVVLLTFAFFIAGVMLFAIYFIKNLQVNNRAT